MYKYEVYEVLTYKNKVIAIKLKDATDLIKIVTVSEIWEYRYNIHNFVITKNGIIRAKHGKLNRREISDEEYINIKEIKTNKKVNKYTIMYENIEVINYYRKNDKVHIVNSDYLPFELRGMKKISARNIDNWITDRVNNINRTYMNLVYIARDVGRDINKIIYDSAGIAITDNFWIKTNDSDLTWDKILKLRDNNIALSNVALTGNMSVDEDLKSGKTSLFALKGHFAKAIINGYMYKNRNDSINEYIAYIIGKQLGIDIQECSLNDKYVKIKLFTDNKISLVHASQLKKYFNNDELLYNNLLNTDRKDLVYQMQRMYIFNYIIGNPDLHEDNYGLLYDSSTFKILKVAPCFDHNCAFQERFLGITNDVDLEEISKKFINNHKDITRNAIKLDYSEINRYLTPLQLEQLKQRISNIINWTEL